MLRAPFNWVLLATELVVSMEEPLEWEMLIWWSEEFGEESALGFEATSRGESEVRPAETSFDLGGVWRGTISSGLPETSAILSRTISSAKSQLAAVASESTS